MTTEYRQLIDGAWCEAGNGQTWDVIDPSSEELVRTVPFGDRTDARLAIEAAARVFPGWAARTPWDRGAILVQAARLIRERAVGAENRFLTAKSPKKAANPSFL